MVELKQFADGSFGLQGDSTGGMGEFVLCTTNYFATSATTQSLLTASRNYVIQNISGRVDVSGTGGACTVSFYVAPSGTALASGALVHTGSFNVAGTANTRQTLTLSTTPSSLVIPAGYSLGYVITGAATSAVGSLTVALSPAN